MYVCMYVCMYLHHFLSRYMEDAVSPAHEKGLYCTVCTYSTWYHVYMYTCMEVEKTRRKRTRVHPKKLGTLLISIASFSDRGIAASSKNRLVSAHTRATKASGIPVSDRYRNPVCSSAVRREPRKLGFVRASSACESESVGIARNGVAIVVVLIYVCMYVCMYACCVVAVVVRVGEWMRICALWMDGVI